MPVWLVKALPYLAALALAAGVAAFLDHRGFERAEQKAALEKAEREKLAAAIVVVIRRDIDRGLAELAVQTNNKFQQINREDRNLVQPLIQKALARDPSLASRSCLTPELLGAVNIARGRQDGQLGTAPDQRTSKDRVP